MFQANYDVLFWDISYNKMKFLMCFNNDFFGIYQEEMEANYKIIVINKTGVLSLVTSLWRPIGTVLVTGKKK